MYSLWLINDHVLITRGQTHKILFKFMTKNVNTQTEICICILLWSDLQSCAYVWFRFISLIIMEMRAQTQAAFPLARSVSRSTLEHQVT